MNLFSALLALQASGATAQDLLGALGGGAAAVEHATCECDFCSVSGRPPSQQVNGADVMCSPQSGSGGSAAPQTCQVDTVSDPSAARVVNTAQDYIMDVSRFCMMLCKPPGQTIGAACVPTSKEEREEQATSGGNGQDMALEVAQDDTTTALPEEMEAPEQSDTAAVVQQATTTAAAGPPAEVVEEEKEEDKDSGAFVTEAQGYRAKATGLEARAAEAEAKSAHQLALSEDAKKTVVSKGTTITDAKAELEAAAVQARIWAVAAKKAADKAQAELAELKALPEKAANKAAATAVKKLLADAAQNAQQDFLMETKWDVSVPPPAPQAAQTAVGPYMAAMNRAVAVRTAYEVNAINLQNKAEEMQKMARELSKQAVAIQSVGRTADANKVMAQAASMINQANAADDEAQSWHDIANEINTDLPKYQNQAHQAMMRAAAIANPASQPPPPAAALLQQGAQGAKGRPRRNLRSFDQELLGFDQELRSFEQKVAKQ